MQGGGNIVLRKMLLFAVIVVVLAILAMPIVAQDVGVSEPIVAQVASGIEPVLALDGDEQLCESEECSFDVGVNEYSDNEDAQFIQIGYAWAPQLSWGEEVSDGDFAFVVLLPGWYLDLTMHGQGGYRVYNVPKSFTTQQVQDLTVSVASEVLVGQPIEMPTLATFSAIPMWDSEVESESGSAVGAGVGPGDNYPQLDGQQYSCYPQLGPCPRTVTVAPERQIALVFGVQLNYQLLAGPTDNDPQASLRDPELRCDMAILAPGTYNGLILRDARIEVYNTPLFDQAGWFRNLVAERAEEQSIHYGCPERVSVPIWNADGTSLEEYILVWDENHDAIAGGPDPIVTPAS